MKKMPAPRAKAALLKPISVCSAALAKPTLERSIIARANINARNGNSFHRHLAMALSIAAAWSDLVVFLVIICALLLDVQRPLFSIYQNRWQGKSVERFPCHQATSGQVANQCTQ